MMMFAQFLGNCRNVGIVQAEEFLETYGADLPEGRSMSWATILAR